MAKKAKKKAARKAAKKTAPARLFIYKHFSSFYVTSEEGVTNLPEGAEIMEFEWKPTHRIPKKVLELIPDAIFDTVKG